MENNIVDVIANASFYDGKGEFCEAIGCKKGFVQLGIGTENTSVQVSGFKTYEMPSSEAKKILAEMLERKKAMDILTWTATVIDTTEMSKDELKSKLEQELEIYNEWNEIISIASKESVDKKTSVSIELELHGGDEWETYGADTRFVAIKFVHGEMMEAELLDTIEHAVEQTQKWIDKANQEVSHNTEKSNKPKKRDDYER